MATITNTASVPIRGASIDFSNPLTRGLVGYWPMLEGTGETVRDYSGHQNHGTLTNMDPATDWVAGEQGAALDFKGINDYLDMPLPGGSQSLNSVTILGLLRPATVTDSCYVFSGYVQSVVANQRCLILGYQSNYWNVFSQSGYPTGTASDTQMPATAGEWQHIAYMSDGATISGYRNGNLVFSVAGDWDISAPTTGAALGVALTSSGTPENLTWYEGAVACWAVYNRALTPQEVATHYSDPWCLFDRKVYLPSEAPPSDNISGTNAYGTSGINFDWTVNP